MAIMKRKSISKFCAEFRGPRRLAAVSLNLAMIVPPAFLLVALVLGIFLVTGNHDTLRAHGSGNALGYSPFGALAFGGVVKTNDEIGEAIEGIDGRVKGFIAHHESTQAELKERMFALEQRAVSRVDGEGAAGESLGAKIMGSPQFKDFSESGRKSTGLIQVGSFFKTALVSATGFGQPLVVPQRLPYIVTPGLQQLRIRDLLPVLPTVSNMVDYARETSFTNNAAMQGAESSPQVYENVAKAESALGFELAYQPVRTLAHWLPVAKQLLDDATGLQSYLNSRLLYGLKLIEEGQILGGTGVGTDLQGLITAATLYDTGDNVSGDTPIDTIRRGIEQVQLSNYEPDAVVLHPTDWKKIDLIKTTGTASSGEYIIGDPRTASPRVLWGLPVVVTKSMPVGHFMTGAFRQAAILWDRQQATLEISREHADFFIKNMAAILCEERLALTVVAPNALRYGAFAA
jgi:HK97 family phage major capsid protein